MPHCLEVAEYSNPGSFSYSGVCPLKNYNRGGLGREIKEKEMSILRSYKNKYYKWWILYSCKIQGLSDLICLIKFKNENKRKQPHLYTTIASC